MNAGTKIRTILVIATCLNTALLATDVAQFGNETVNLIYKILSVAANIVIVFCATWFNNDYTEEDNMVEEVTGGNNEYKCGTTNNNKGDYINILKTLDNLQHSGKYKNCDFGISIHSMNTVGRSNMLAYANEDGFYLVGG